METEKRVIESAISHYLIKNPSDVQIAYERGFQKKAVELSKLFEEHYPNVSTMSDIEIMRIFRYFMGKAAETCIADELYQSDKERICNITYLLSDVDNEYFKINIPAHYMFELSDLAMHYLLPIKEDVEYMRSEKDLMSSLSSAIVYWQVVAYSHAHLRKAYTAHGKYENNSIKTLDEIRICAFKGMLQNLSSNGWKIEKMNYLLSNPWNVIAKYKDKDYALLLRTNHGLFKASIAIEDLEKLVDYVKGEKDKKFSVGYILINIESADEQHQSDKVIITGDKMKFEITDLQLYDQKEQE